jgi:hypothetical protein
MQRWQTLRRSRDPIFRIVTSRPSQPIRKLEEMRRFWVMELMIVGGVMNLLIITLFLNQRNLLSSATAPLAKSSHGRDQTSPVKALLNLHNTAIRISGNQLSGAEGSQLPNLSSMHFSHQQQHQSRPVPPIHSPHHSRVVGIGIKTDFYHSRVMRRVMRRRKALEDLLSVQHQREPVAVAVNL